MKIWPLKIAHHPVGTSFRNLGNLAPRFRLVLVWFMAWRGRSSPEMFPIPGKMFPFIAMMIRSPKTSLSCMVWRPKRSIPFHCIAWWCWLDPEREKKESKHDGNPSKLACLKAVNHGLGTAFKNCKFWQKSYVTLARALARVKKQ